MSKEKLRVIWYQRFQVEVGGRWQAVPDSQTTWKQWLFDPFYRFTYPGKFPVTRADFPDFPLHGSINFRDDKQMESLIYWASAGCRVLGLDLGAGVFYRPKRSVEKILGVKR